MRRVLWLGSYGKGCVPELNKWLLYHPDAELVDIKPVVDGEKTEVFCIVDIPDSVNVKSWPECDRKSMWLLPGKEGNAE